VQTDVPGGENWQILRHAIEADVEGRPLRRSGRRRERFLQHPRCPTRPDGAERRHRGAGAPAAFVA
jgi:hypothetical protein